MTGSAIGTGVATGLSAGICSIVEAADQSGFLTEAQIEQVLSIEAEIMQSISGEKLPDTTSAAGSIAECGTFMALSAPDEPAPPQLVAEARRLQDRLRGQRLLRRIAPVAAAVALFAAGWTGNLVWQATGPEGAPPLVEAALDAQAALELRHWMVSQPESADLNPQEIVEALGIDLPPLPEDWTVRDVQIVATPERPAVAISVDAPDLGPILMMAVARSAVDVENAPTAFEYEGRTIALFERGRSSFVLVDESGHPEQLVLGADRLLSRADGLDQ